MNFRPELERGGLRPTRGVVALAQGLFYVATGLWPIASIDSFEAVTGRKRELWLVKTMGALIAAVGAALVVGSRERGSRAVRALGIGSAAALGAADVVYATKRRISRVYPAGRSESGPLRSGLADAAVGAPRSSRG